MVGSCKLSQLERKVGGERRERRERRERESGESRSRDDGSDSVKFFSVNDPGLSKKSLLSDKGNFYVQS